MNSNHGSLDAGGLKSELPIVQQVTETRTDDSNRPPSERWCHDALLWWAPTEESPHLPHLPTCLGQSCPFRLLWPAAQNPTCTAEWHNHSLAETPSSPVSHQGVGSQRDCLPILAEYKKKNKTWVELNQELWTPQKVSLCSLYLNLNMGNLLKALSWSWTNSARSKMSKLQ